jgi:hypothetical protein
VEQTLGRAASKDSYAPNSRQHSAFPARAAVQYGAQRDRRQHTLLLPPLLLLLLLLLYSGLSGPASIEPVFMYAPRMDACAGSAFPPSTCIT